MIKIKQFLKKIYLICIILITNCLKTKSSFKNSEETTNYIRENKCSFIRFGDGEFEIMLGNKIHYQDYDEKLAIELEQIIKNYIENSNSTKYLVGMPEKYLGKLSITLKNNAIYWAKSNFLFKRKFNRNIVYGDAFLFGKGKKEIYKKIWCDNGIKHVIFVHNNYHYANLFSKEYNIKKVDYIDIPPKNAYQNIKSIISRIKGIQGYNSEDCTILVSAGPAGKIISYNLTLCDCFVIDTGHCWDDPLTE